MLLCRQFTQKPDLATHEIRKASKRIRAVYRLFRKATGEDQYRHSKAFYADLSHMLAVYRISAVNIETLRWLTPDKRLPVNSGFMHDVTATLEKRHQQLTSIMIEEQQVDRNLSDKLRAEIESLNAHPLFSCDFHNLVPGLRNTYNSGKTGLDQALFLPTTENLHEFRKVVKSLWIQFLLLRPIWPSYVGLAAHQLDILAQRLGLEHDLAELEQLLVRDRTGDNPVQLSNLLDFIAKKRQIVQKTLIPLARRLYFEKPRTMGIKMEGFYRLYAGHGLG
jgi:CHAD domain-containing protein